MNNKFVREWGPYLVIVVIVVLIRSFIVTPVVVNGDSMYDTLKDKEVLLLSKIAYKLSSIKRFDIVVIKDIDGDLIIKRVIGMPGDNVLYDSGILYINGKEVEDKYANSETDDFNLEDICKIRDNECNGKIPSDMYLVLGDNRMISADSRIKGLIYKKDIKGKAAFRIWPLNKISNLSKN